MKVNLIEQPPIFQLELSKQDAYILKYLVGNSTTEQLKKVLPKSLKEEEIEAFANGLYRILYEVV